MLTVKEFLELSENGFDEVTIVCNGVKTEFDDNKLQDQNFSDIVAQFGSYYVVTFRLSGYCREYLTLIVTKGGEKDYARD